MTCFFGGERGWTKTQVELIFVADWKRLSFFFCLGGLSQQASGSPMEIRSLVCLKKNMVRGLFPL